MSRINSSGLRLSGGGIISAVRNIPRAIAQKTGIIPNLRPLYSGELHLPAANYAGPRTQVAKRVARGDVGTSATDSAAKQHDLDYSYIKQLKDAGLPRQERVKLVEKSDKRLLDSTRNGLSRDRSALNKMHALGTIAGIESKKWLSKEGILDPLKFAGGGFQGGISQIIAPLPERPPTRRGKGGKKYNPAAKLMKMIR